MNRVASDSTMVNGRPPAQADIQRFFQVTAPSVHQMLLTLERGGLISRRPGAPRSIAVLVDRSDLPALEPGYAQPVKITVARYQWTKSDGKNRHIYPLAFDLVIRSQRLEVKRWDRTTRRRLSFKRLSVSASHKSQAGCMYAIKCWCLRVIDDLGRLIA
jgi:hypothetical protein